MRDIVAFSDSHATLSEVGGKGLSLARMRQAGLAVPEGVLLTTLFFEPWVSALRKTPEWTAMVRGAEAPLPELTRLCDALKAAAAQLAFSAQQHAAVQAALQSFADNALFAVRSSSPEEDLEGASFAGGYETVLGVARSALPQAVRQAFASCLDARVMVYKRERGFDATQPRIAVVVQQQIASDVAGVGLSLNPISNAYDEAVFNANWGLGESVVSGRASPDFYAVDKLTRTVVTRQLGQKETSLWLDPAGRTFEKQSSQHATWTLHDDQVLALTDQIIRIEQLYGRPMDIEWAFAEGHLYLLQARPMTAFLQLPADLMTAPGHPKRLYFDVTLSVQGFAKPVSILGTSFLSCLAGTVSQMLVGADVTANLDVAVGVVRCGRLYLNAAKIVPLLGRDRVLAAMHAFDPLAAQALAIVDAAMFSQPMHPSPRLLRIAPLMLLRVVWALLAPVRYRGHVEARVAAHADMLQRQDDATRPLPDNAAHLIKRTFRDAVLHVLPALVAWKVASSRIARLFPQPPAATQVLLAKLDQSLPGNVTVQMGLDLGQLGHQGAALEKSPEWAKFLATYGHRGPGELDIAAPRYRETPQVLLQQAQQMAQGEGPAARYARNQQERQDAVASLAAALPKRQARRFRRLVQVIESFGGYRETPKFLLIRVLDRVRTHVLSEAAKLLDARRIDHIQDIFNVTLQDIEAARHDPAVDLRARQQAHASERESFTKARELPRLIDSRGRIFRAPPQPLKPGELAGQPVSAGVARGPVKVLAHPDEKPLLVGDILVARATDPGWTPLFVNAAAVVLEVGGAMQHGALVAREYGKPCVSGVENATDRLHDGQWIEVDGASGTVRVLERPA